MKKLSTVLLVFISVIIALVSLAFAVIEARLVFSFDWSVYEHEFLGFIQHLARLGVALLCLAVSVSSIKSINEKTFIFEGVTLLAVAISVSVHAVNGIGLYMMIAAALYLVFASLHGKFFEEDE